jgi:hypothetical protein
MLLKDERLHMTASLLRKVVKILVSPILPYTGPPFVIFGTLFFLGRKANQHFNRYVKLLKALGGGWLSKDEMNSVQHQ